MTAVQEGLKITVLLVDNYGYGSIAALSETRGSQGFACRFNYRGEDGQFSEDRIDIDLAANAASYGADVFTAATADELQKALADAAGIDNTVVIYVKVDAKGRFGGSGAWWDVPVSEVSELDSTQQARKEYEDADREPEALPVTAADSLQRHSDVVADIVAKVPTQLIIGGAERAGLGRRDVRRLGSRHRRDPRHGGQRQRRRRPRLRRCRLSGRAVVGRRRHHASGRRSCSGPTS